MDLLSRSSTEIVKKTAKCRISKNLYTFSCACATRRADYFDTSECDSVGSSCINDWNRVHNTCPICRRSLDGVNSLSHAWDASLCFEDMSQIESDYVSSLRAWPHIFVSQFPRMTKRGTAPNMNAKDFITMIRKASSPQ